MFHRFRLDPALRHRTAAWAAALGLGLAATLVAGAAPASAAASAIPRPTQYTTVPAPVNGNPHDPCGKTEPYGYVGITVSELTFSAVVHGAPADTQAQAHFQLWPTGAPSSVTDVTSAPVPVGETASVQVPESSFTDGTTYAWRVRDETAAGDSGWTAPCHFIRDLVPPPAPTITSASFPATGSTPVRTYGTFTFSVPTPTRVVGFDYVLNGTLSVAGNAFVKIGPDGTATTPPLASGLWGTNAITVQSVDIAGNESRPVNYDFYLTPDPTPDKYGDLNGDGDPDLLAIGADGGLDFAAGIGDGHVAKPVDTDAQAPAYPADWAGALISTGGDFNEDGYQDLAVIQNGNLYIEDGTGLGGFSGITFVEPPSTQPDWSGATQVISAGDLDGDGRADFVVKQGDQLLFLAGEFENFFADPVPIAGDGWSGMTVVGFTDVTGDGIPDLIARDDASGVIWLYPGAGDGTFGDASTRVQIGSGLSAAAFPLVITKGDVTGDGRPDIWAVGASGGLYLLAGTSGGGFGAPHLVSGAKFWSGVTALG